MQLKLYAAFCLLFVVLFQDNLVGGMQENGGKSDNEIRRGARSAIIKTAAVAGIIGLVAGLIIGHKKASNKASNHHHHNWKRSIGEDLHPSPDLSEEELIRAAAILDHLGCGGRLLCELHQKHPDDLDHTGRKLVQLFSEKTAPTIVRLQTDPKAVFQYAAFVGASSPKDLKICSKVFNRCPLNADAILDGFDSGYLSPNLAENSSSHLER